MKVKIKACILSLLCPLLAHGQEVGLLRIDPDNREPMTHVAVWGGIEDGRYRPMHEAQSLWKAGAEARRIGQRPHTTWLGALSFEQKMGKYTQSSLLLDPVHYPMDVVDLTRGTKSMQDLRLEGGFLSDINDIWAAGLKGTVQAEHAAKQKGIPYGTFGVKAELAPVLTYLIDDNVGFVASYHGCLRTENASVKAAGEEVAENSLFLDEGQRYGAYLPAGSASAWSVLEFTHGFSGKFHSPEESWGVEMDWKRGQAAGNGSNYRFPGSTLRAFFDYDYAAETTSHLFGFSYQRDRDQLRLVSSEGGFSALSDRVDRRLDLKYGFRIYEGVLKKILLVAEGGRVTERAMSGVYDRTVRYDGTAKLLASLSAGLFDLDVDALAGGGKWEDRGLVDPPETAVRLTDDWLRQMEFLMAPKVGLGGTLTARIPAVDGLYCKLYFHWDRALRATYLPGKNREAVTLTIGYDY